MTRSLTILLLCLPMLSQANSNFGDPQLGKIKAPSCVFCHGADGVATNPTYPNLNGQDVQYLYQSMKAYQNGERVGPLAEMMTAQLSRLDDQDLKDVAAYFAQQ
ncbi:c-type cytochrome [Vibrio sinaloensis]|uniref:c-type cytochrome n=1 Tax=Photobacterium sp. (strain ATCC 43367) TaxID=379097 RepID=UPI002050B2C4|nr:cytochrome c [Vibrio sinaloensis]UPQ90073.1 cytochrome c [Vibrio sinaloensis]